MKARASSGRINVPLRDGIVVVGCDGHYWPGKPTPAHRAFVAFIRKMHPALVVMNGDVIDASTISRHPPIGWEDHPTVAQELEVAKARLTEVEKASPASRFIWTLGNHDARFETRLASVAPEYKHIKGVHLKDHFPAWEPAWSVDVGGPRGAIIKHRWKGGNHAAFNNAVASGRTIVTGHYHRLGVVSYTDYTGTRYGVEGGMLSRPESAAFTGYTEGNPLSWHPGFVILTFRKGLLLPPELVHVLNRNEVTWRGEVINV